MVQKLEEEQEKTKNTIGSFQVATNQTIEAMRTLQTNN